MCAVALQGAPCLLLVQGPPGPGRQTPVKFTMSSCTGSAFALPSSFSPPSLLNRLSPPFYFSSSSFVLPSYFLYSYLSSLLILRFISSLSPSLPLLVPCP